jgi:hypothetical protein
MQVSSTPTILPGGCYGTHASSNVDHGPIGVSTFGTLRIGHALNGVTYTEHHLMSPVTPPVAHFTGSFDDAIAGAQKFLARQELDDAGRGVLAITGLGGSWDAHIVFSDPTVVRAIDNGAGSGGIASIEFTARSRSLAALVTSKGVLAPH